LARVTAYNEISVIATVRYVRHRGLWTYFDLWSRVLVSFDRNGIEQTYNHLNVHIVDTPKKGLRSDERRPLLNPA
jgi:small conductance mechanosensitive channel